MLSVRCVMFSLFAVCIPPGQRSDVGGSGGRLAWRHRLLCDVHVS